jgi:molybdopterin converting factor small subunit
MPQVRIPVPLRSHTGGTAHVEVEGETVGELLDSLFERYSALADEITEADQLKTSTYESFNLLVGREDAAELQGRETPVDSRQTVMLVRTWPAAISGGRQWNQQVGEPPPD